MSWAWSAPSYNTQPAPPRTVEKSPPLCWPLYSQTSKYTWTRTRCDHHAFLWRIWTRPKRCSSRKRFLLSWGIPAVGSSICEGFKGITAEFATRSKASPALCHLTWSLSVLEDGLRLWTAISKIGSRSATSTGKLYYLNCTFEYLFLHRVIDRSHLLLGLKQVLQLHAI